MGGPRHIAHTLHDGVAFLQVSLELQVSSGDVLDTNHKNSYDWKKVLIDGHSFWL